MESFQFKTFFEPFWFMNKNYYDLFGVLVVLFLESQTFVEHNRLHMPLFWFLAINLWTCVSVLLRNRIDCLIASGNIFAFWYKCVPMQMRRCITSYLIYNRWNIVLDIHLPIPLILECVHPCICPWYGFSFWLISHRYHQCQRFCHCCVVWDVVMKVVNQTNKGV